jgi:hypothetical protein
VEEEKMSLQIRLYLKRNACEKLVERKQRGLIGDVRVSSDETIGMSYISSSDLLDPIITKIPQSLIRFVTLRENVEHVLSTVPEGVYRLNKAEMTVRWQRAGLGELSRRFQIMSIKGPN